MSTSAGAGVRFDERAVDAVFRPLDRCDLPGAAVGIAIRGRPVYRKGFGLACLGIPRVLSPAVRMRAGTLTRHFTCLAYLLLCQEGRAGIDDPLGKHFPELHPVARRVTLRQLMANTSGLRDPYDICFEFSGFGQGVTSTELLALYRDIDDVNLMPDTAWSFSHGDGALLGVVTERVAGQPLEDVLRERIFERVGMYDTRLRRWDTDYVSNAAAAHMVGADGAYESCDCMDFAGAGAMISSVDDLLRWLAHMDAPTVGSAATWAMMSAPHRLANGTSTGSGLGWMTGRYRGVDVLHHSGAWLGSSAKIVKVPAHGLDVVVMVNHHGTPAAVFANRVLDACLPALEPVREASSGPTVSGLFRSPASGRVVQLFDRGGAQMISLDGQDMRFELHADGVLRAPATFGEPKQALHLHGNPAAPAAIGLDDYGNREELLAVPPASEAVPAPAGCYLSRSTGTEATVSADGRELLTRGRFGSMRYGLECLCDGVWRARLRRTVIPFGGLLAFSADAQRFHFSNSLTRLLPFTRCA